MVRETVLVDDPLLLIPDESSGTASPKSSVQGDGAAVSPLSPAATPRERDKSRSPRSSDGGGFERKASAADAFGDFLDIMEVI